MVVTITYKTSTAIGADPAALKKQNLCKFDGAIIPLSEGGDAENEALFAAYSKAKKREKKCRQKIELKSHKGNSAFKKTVSYYLADTRCLLVSLFEDNARQKLQHRKSLQELVDLANQYDILKCLDEPAKIWVEKKSSGTGVRVICSFRPVARAAQRMVIKILRTTYQPQVFQYTKLGSAQKVQLGMSLIKEKGYNHVVEIDIKDFFPSFTEEELIAALPLPKEAIRHIVLAKSADWTPCCCPTTQSYILSPPGIPQGSAASSEIAHWCIANMKLKKLESVDVLNHVDNFFGFAISQSHMENASKALSSSITGLLGGEFIGNTEQDRKIEQGFRMLGCYISVDKKGKIVVDPTETNWLKLTNRVGELKRQISANLTEADYEGIPNLRIQGLQNYLRLESICQGWFDAFKFCGPHMEHVESQHAFELDLIRNTFGIEDTELKPLKDASTNVKIKWCSGK